MVSAVMKCFWADCPFGLVENGMRWVTLAWVCRARGTLGLVISLFELGVEEWRSLLLGCAIFILIGYKKRYRQEFPGL